MIFDALFFQLNRPRRSEPSRFKKLPDKEDIYARRLLVAFVLVLVLALLATWWLNSTATYQGWILR